MPYNRPIGHSAFFEPAFAGPDAFVPALVEDLDTVDFLPEPDPAVALEALLVDVLPDALVLALVAPVLEADVLSATLALEALLPAVLVDTALLPVLVALEPDLAPAFWDSVFTAASFVSFFGAPCPRMLGTGMGIRLRGLGVTGISPDVALAAASAAQRA